jgi:hypothetical protein
MEKMSITNNLFQKGGLQTGVTYASNQHLTIGASSGSQTTALNNAIHAGIVRARLFVSSEITSAMLESEAFNVPVDSLVNIWVMRFGHDWVELERIEEDAFFSVAFKRLKQLGEVEVHFLTDRARYVCRMPE